MCIRKALEKLTELGDSGPPEPMAVAPADLEEIAQMEGAHDESETEGNAHGHNRKVISLPNSTGEGRLLFTH
ncbi:MAG: hypothetical protein A3A24_02740 [Candidatus Buchananbacteria bacterium RIFCSPLOWO2_01_FULL_46_12]|nr:MAG: hypothetical protein A3A24_02740 [Candidatus Buchananbacteria bacterium RIFCSPLOWO2_01_FULL_46_12]